MTNLAKNLEAADDQQGVRQLKLTVPPGDFAAVVATIKRALAERPKSEPPKGQPLDLTALHPDASFAADLTKGLAEGGATNIKVVTAPDDALGALQRRIDGLIVWFDGAHPAPGLVLEQIAEARRLPWVPVLVLVPGESALRQLALTQAGTFFDGVAVFGRKSGALAPALAALRDVTRNQSSARAILERLRRPFRPERTAADKLDLDEARRLAALLGGKPGKRYWGTCELIPHLLTNKRLEEAQQAAAALVREDVAQFNTLFMQQVVAAAVDREAGACGLVAATLKWPALTRSRLARVGELLERWQTADALADLLDGWQARRELASGPAMLSLAARYYQMTERPEVAGRFLVAAVLQAPLQHEPLTALTVHLAEGRLHDRTSDFCRLAIQAGVDTAAMRVRLVRALVEGRRMREARTELAACLQKFPDDKAALDLKRQLG